MVDSKKDPPIEPSNVRGNYGIAGSSSGVIDSQMEWMRAWEHQHATGQMFQSMGQLGERMKIEEVDLTRVKSEDDKELSPFSK